MVECSDKMKERMGTELKHKGIELIGSQKYDVESESRLVLEGVNAKKKRQDLIELQVKFNKFLQYFVKGDFWVSKDKIGSVLKQKVKENYSVFIECSDDINSVGTEILQLRYLVEKTQSFVKSAIVHCNNTNLLQDPPSLLATISGDNERDLAYKHNERYGQNIRGQFDNLFKINCLKHFLDN